MSIAYMQQSDQFIANRVYPVLPVDKRSDLFRIYQKDDWFRDEAEKRGPATESAGGGYDITQDSYFCDVYAFHKDIDDQTRDNSDADINLDRDATEFVTQRMLLKREKVWVTQNFQPGVWGTTVTGVASGPGAGQVLRWDDANSDPRANMKAARRAILSVTGYKPNTLVLHYDAMDALADHPDFVERIKYTSTDSIDEAMLARIFKVDRVLVAGAIENSAKEGNVADFDFIYGKHAWLGYVAPRPSLMAPSAGYTFSWKHAPLSNDQSVQIKRFRMEPIASERIEGEIAFDDKIVGTDLGYFFEDIVS
ncbi:MAG TPA: major capsid protein [Polyangiaceae bacterium]|nr:major capsid protein [Polyangiaceae bacterium]